MARRHEHQLQSRLEDAPRKKRKGKVVSVRTRKDEILVFDIWAARARGACQGRARGGARGRARVREYGTVPG